MITIQTIKQVHVKLPAVYRYMQASYISDFFDHGRLRISSFQRFRDYPDEIRGDKREAQGSATGKGGDEFTFHVMTDAGANGYMLSASLEDSAAIKKEFDVDSYFEIFDPLGFSVAVANALPGQQEAFLGFCNYQDKRVIEKTLEEMSLSDFTGEDGNIVLMHPKMNERIHQLVGNGIDFLFLKDKKYQSQSEFRFVWRIDGAHFDVKDHVDIICKEAIQFCRMHDSEKSGASDQAMYGS
jgi:hypothetical protein